MDAIEYLTEQHREIDSLFDQIESAARANAKLRLCRKLVDLLAVHTSIEEMIFYPAAQEAGIEELLPRVFEEHYSVERIIAELVRVGWANDAAAPKIAALQERKRQHAEQEEEELFPRVRGLLTRDQLEAVGERMASVAEQLLGPGVGARERIFARRAVA
jgi:hemerythrin superfamily protein